MKLNNYFRKWEHHDCFTYKYNQKICSWEVYYRQGVCLGGQNRREANFFAPALKKSLSGGRGGGAPTFFF